MEEISKKIKNDKILYVQTVNTPEFRNLIDFLKDILTEVKLDFLAPESDDELHSDSGEESDQDETDTSDKKSKAKKKGRPKKEEGKKKKDKKDTDQDQIVKKKNTKTDSGSPGIRIMEVNQLETLLIYIKLNADKFPAFYVKNKAYSVGLDLCKLNSWFKYMNKESVLTISIDKDDEQSICFETEDKTSDSIRRYTQKLMDTDHNEKNIPSQRNFMFLVTMETARFYKICKCSSQFSDFMEITCTADEIVFKCVSDSNTEAPSEIFKNNKKSVKITDLTKNKKPDKKNKKGKALFKEIYQISELVSFNKCSSICKYIQLLLRPEFPMFINYKISNIGKMFIGIVPVDDASINMKEYEKDNEYDEIDKYYVDKNKVKMKEDD